MIPENEPRRGTEGRPPAVSRWILRRLLDPYTEGPFLGDLDEEFLWRVRSGGLRRSRLWYRWQIVKSLPFIMKQNLFWRCELFLSSLKTAFRNMKRQAGFFFINNTGLAVGLAVCILIFLWVQDEAGFDRFHKNKDNLYITYTTLQYPNGQRQQFMTSYFPLARTLKADCPEVAEAVRYATEGGISVRRGDKAFFDEVLAFVDPAFFNIFTFPFLKGDPRTAFADKLVVVITEETARKFFGSEDPLGKTLYVADRVDLKVTGVMKNVPGNSSLQFGLVVPFPFFFGGPDRAEPEHWGGNPLNTIVLLGDSVRPGEAERTMTEVVRKRANFPKGMTATMGLHPVARVHLYDIGGGGRIRTVVLFSTVALLVLVLACINFINLATARSSVRTKEIGMRKVVGARRSDLIRQLLGESVLASALAFFTALILVMLALPPFNALSGKRLSLALLGSPGVLAGILAIVLFSGLLSGSYPAFILASIRPIRLFKGGSSGDPRSPAFRKALVVAQYAVSIVLLTGVFIIHGQLDFMRTKERGFDGRHLILVSLPESAVPGFDALKNDLLSKAGILGVTRSVQRPDFIGSTVSALNWDGKNPNEQVSMNWDYVDFDYFETLKIPAVAGRVFSRDHPSDPTGAYVVNEEAARLMGMESPVGRRLTVFRQEGTIIGVVKDFHYQPLQHKIGPIVFGMNPSWRENMRNMFIRAAAGAEPDALRSVEAGLKAFDSGRPFIPRRVEELLMGHYESERRMEKIIGFFAFLALFISCLGLFALASFMADRRRKEIGIRKVMGASSTGVALLLTGEFVKRVAVANALAWPVAYYAADRWLQNYAYRWTITPWIFALAAGLTLAVAVLAVGLKSLRTASANPSETLRYE